ncbi:MAG: M23 family metallopeptidase [Cyanobacteria bacterium J06635_1]
MISKWQHRSINWWIALALSLSGWGVSRGALAQGICGEPALDKVVSHTVTEGETLESIANEYGLLSATLLRFNPNGARVGQSISVPPFDGIAVEATPGQTWSAVAEQYQASADVLFEINGCQATVPNQIFIPGRNRVLGISSTTQTTQQLPGYPLPESAPIVLSYGWQPHPTRDEIIFNSGIALTAAPGTSVITVADGTVAFAGPQADSGSADNGNLVVVNHRQGLQTRYANLDELTVSVGDTVRQDDSLGTVRGIEADSFVYFEVRTNSELGWVAQDPAQYMPALGLR